MCIAVQKATLCIRIGKACLAQPCERRSTIAPVAYTLLRIRLPSKVASICEWRRTNSAGAVRLVGFTDCTSDFSSARKLTQYGKVVCGTSF